MNKHGALGALVAASIGCGGHNVVSRPMADPDVVIYAGTDAVAVGSGIAVMVTWHGWCEQPAIGVTGGDGTGRGPCEYVAHTASFRCEREACTWKSTGGSGYQLVPTKPGTMKAFVTVTPKDSGAPKTYPIDPVEVVVPDAVAMSCTILGDYSSVTLALTHAGKAVQASAPTLRVNDRACTYDAPLEPGDLSAPMTMLTYTCDSAAADARAQIAAADYRFDASARCAQ